MTGCFRSALLHRPSLSRLIGLLPAAAVLVLARLVAGLVLPIVMTASMLPRSLTSQLVDRRRRNNNKNDATDSPSSPPKSLRNSPRNASSAAHTDQLSSLLKQMDELILLDRILDARKVVDQIRETETKIGFSPHGLISPATCAKMDEIVSESNHIARLLSDLRNDDDWHLVKSRGGISVHYRNEEGSPIHSVKTHTILENVDPVGFVRICSLFLESDLFPLWAPHHIIESCDILAAPSKYRQILQMKFSFGKYSPLSPRDAIVEGRGYHLADENAVLILSTSIRNTPFCDIPPKTRSRVRIDIHAAFYVQLLPGNRVLFRQISHDDLKVRFMPAFVVNFLAQGAFPYAMIQGLRTVLGRYEDTEFYTRMKQRREFYAEIEDRVHKELVSNASRMDSGDVAATSSGDETEQLSWSGANVGEDRDVPVEGGVSTKLLGRDIGRAALVANSSDSSRSLVLKGIVCLACVVIAQLCVRLSLYWTVLPRQFQVATVLCVVSLPLLMYLGSKVGNRRHRAIIRVTKWDVSVASTSTELPVDSSERQHSTPDKISLKAPPALVYEPEMSSEKKVALPSSIVSASPSTSAKQAYDGKKKKKKKKKKKRPTFLRKITRRKMKDNNN